MYYRCNGIIHVGIMQKNKNFDGLRFLIKGFVCELWHDLLTLMAIRLVSD